jgi:NADH:ubiquinone oxidoreductase subunit 6 (subunit J)
MSQLLIFREPLIAESFSGIVAEFWPVLLPALLGAAAVYFLLPRIRGGSLLWGCGLGAIALVLAGVFAVRISAALPETILFYAFSAVALVAGTLLITHHNPVYAALAFALVVLSTCGLFLLLAAPFLMAATVIIYAGAIIVTFLFVIMLAQQAGLSSADLRSREPFLASVAGFILLGAILCVLWRTYDTASLGPYLSKLQKAADAKSENEIQQALDGEPAAFLKSFFTAVEGKPRHGKLSAAILTAEELVNTKPMDMAQVTAKLNRIHELGAGLQMMQGSLVPAGDKPLSTFSGIPANHPPSPPKPGVRPAQRLPAENVASLGRSLFSDYLITTELAGTLLLVATIGAIAIAGRRAEART